jgi:hypothetical protein
LSTSDHAETRQVSARSFATVMTFDPIAEHADHIESHVLPVVCD